MTKSLKTSEFYVVIAVLLVWGLRYLGLDISQDQAQDAVVGVAEQLRGINDTSDLGAWVGVVYVAARSLLKGREIKVNGEKEEKEEKNTI